MNENHVPREDLVIPPCKEACPAGVDVARHIRCIKEGKFDEALAVLREKIPFPAMLGYACYSPCEAKCGNRQFGESIAIRALHRIAAEKGGELWRKNLTIAPATSRRVAMVGSGPSGLTAAYYLATLGHKVTVLEALDQPGGMMRVGIPEYRLPREALDKEISYIKEIGVELKTETRVDSVDQLFEEGYDAVYLACGAHQGAKLGIRGDDAPGVVDGISFLREVNEGKKIKIGKRVAVIGGGNTAVDASRCAIRLGAEKITVIYRRSQAEMTAYEEEVAAAGEEGVKIDFLTAPLKVSQKDGALEVTFTRMELGRPDASGRSAPVPVEGSEFKQVFENVIAAVGQVSDVTESMGISLADGKLVQVDAETLATDKSGVFAGGDVVSGPVSIIDAIAHGRKAASSIDKFLGGDGIIYQDLASPEEEVIVTEHTIGDQARVAMPCSPLTDRTCGFEPVELGFTEELALKEVARCRSCDARQFEVVVYGEGCKECGYCIEVCGLDVFEPAEKFNKKGYRPVIADHMERCVGCDLCFYACPDFSIMVKESA